MSSIQKVVDKQNREFQNFFKQKKLKIGARKSLLSRLQAYEVGIELKRFYPQLELQFVFTSSFGDKNLDLDFRKIEHKGVFTEDLREALRKKNLDLLVHSWKDLPTERDEEKGSIFTLLRADQRDLLLLKKGSLERIKKTKSLRVFTSSPRRSFQVREFIKEGFFPFKIEKIKILPIRGNIPTRLDRLTASKKGDALILAKAALDRLLVPIHEIHENFFFQEPKEQNLKVNPMKASYRMNQTKDFFQDFLSALPEWNEEELISVQNKIRSILKDCLWTIFPLKLFPTSPAQGALAIEILKERRDLKKLLTPLHKKIVSESVLKERTILRALGGGCYQNIGVSSLRRPYGKITYFRGDFSLNKTLNHSLRALFKGSLRFEIKKEKPHEVLENLDDLKDQPGRKKSNLSKSVKNLVSKRVRWEKATRANIFPLYAHQAKFFKRETFKEEVLERERDFSFSNSFFWVSKENALPKIWDLELKKKRPILWVSGVKTWKKLALRGLWVHGCSESLGESEKEEIERILGKKRIPWIKFTHFDSVHFKGKKKYATYRLLPLSKIPNLKDKTHFYWQSESQFLFALKKYKNIEKAFHASGPGHTFQAIKRKIPKEKRRIFLSHRAWKEFILSEI